MLRSTEDGRQERGLVFTGNWNIWGNVDSATALMGEAGPFSAKDLIGKISAD